MTGRALWTARLLAGLLAGVVLRLVFTGHESDASHTGSPPRSLIDMRTATDQEHYCIRVVFEPLSPVTVDFLTAYTRVKLALQIENPDQDWNGLGVGKIDFRPQPSDCRRPVKDEFGNFPFNSIEYFVGSDLEDACGDPNASCVAFMNQPEWTDPVTGHEWMTSAHVHLNVWHLLEVSPPYSYRGIVNHETGHLFGLIDNVDANVPCGDSIMHYRHGCEMEEASTWPYPTDDDRAAVEALMPPPDFGHVSSGCERGFMC